MKWRRYSRKPSYLKTFRTHDAKCNLCLAPATLALVHENNPHAGRNTYTFTTKGLQPNSWDWGALCVYWPPSRHLGFLSVPRIVPHFAQHIAKMVLKVYLDMMSQPCRALYMFLVANKIPFEKNLVHLRKGPPSFPSLLHEGAGLVMKVST